MPQQVDFVNGKLVITGDDTAHDHIPMPDAPAAPAPKAKPKPKPKGKAAPPPKPWWQNLPHVVGNELRYAGKVIQSLEATQKGGPAKPGLMNLVDAVNPIGGALRQAGRLSPTVRQVTAAATYGAAQTAGEGIIAIGQHMFKGAKFADPKASRPGQLLNAVTRAGYAATGAKQPEDLTEPQRGIIDTQARMLGVEVGTGVLTPELKLFQGAGMVNKGLRLGTRLGLAHGVSAFTQDSTLGNMSNMAEALTGQKIPGAVDPLKDDRVTAGMKSVLPNMIGGEALGLGIVAGARVVGKLGDQFPNIARQKRARRANTEHTTANERVKATGLVEDIDGRQQFTDAARAKPAPIPMTVDERTQQILDRFGPPNKPADKAPGTSAAQVAEPALPPPPPSAPPLPREIPSQEMAPGGPVLNPDAPLGQADPAIDPWFPDAPAAPPRPPAQPAPAAPPPEISPAEEFWSNGDTPEIADVQKTLDQLDDNDLTALAAAGADGGPVLQQLNDLVATRSTPRIRAEVSEDAAGMPTANLSDLYLNGAGDLQPWIKQFDKIPTVTLQELAHPEASPRLFELIHAATGRDWEAFTRADIVAGIKEFSFQGTTILPNRLRDDVTLTPIGKVVARPKEFQYKENVNAKGEQMGHSLGGVDKWNPNLEGVVDVFTDPKTGETVVVNGHNRRALAERLGVPSLITREVDATTPSAARAEGAMANIAAGAGTPFDAAKFIKATGLTDAAQLYAAGIPTDKGYGRQGLALSRLPAEIFQDAVSEIHDLGRYLDLGASGLDEAGMRGAYKVLQQRPKMSAGAFREVIGKAGEQGNVIVSSPQGSLFGDDVLNPIEQWAELVADVRQGLSRERRIFGNSIKNAGALGEAGVADVNTGIAGQRVTDASHALDLFDRLKNAPGPLADVLNRGAAEIANGSKPGVIAKQVQREIANNIETYLSEAGLKPRGGADDPAPMAPPAAPSSPAAITPEVLPPAPRADLERHALQRAIANGEVRPTETGPVEVPEGLGGDWGDMQHEQALGADFYSQDTMAKHEATKAMREAEGYDFKPWEERRQESGVGEEWLAPAPTPLPFEFYTKPAFNKAWEIGRKWKNGEINVKAIQQLGNDLTPDMQEARSNLAQFFSITRKFSPKTLTKEASDFLDFYENGQRAFTDFADLLPQNQAESLRLEASYKGWLAPAPDAVAQKASGEPSASLTFTTERGGSIYTVNPDGGTTRVKGASNDPVHLGDVGPKPASKLTVYVDPDTAKLLGDTYLQGQYKPDFKIKDGKLLFEDYKITRMEPTEEAIAANLPGKIKSVTPRITELPFSTTPTVGLHPVEVGDGWKHVGSKINNVAPAPDAINPEVLPPEQPKKISQILRETLRAIAESDARMLRGTQAFLDDMGNLIGDEPGQGTKKAKNSALPTSAKKALVASQVSNAPPFVLPQELSKAAPRYGNKKLEFESDLDRTAYMLASDRTKGESKAAQKYQEALAAAGFSVDQVAAHGALVKKAVKDGVKDADGATATIPVQPFGGDTPRLPLPEQGRKAGKAKQQITDLKNKLNEGGCGL